MVLHLLYSDVNEANHSHQRLARAKIMATDSSIGASIYIGPRNVLTAMFDLGQRNTIVGFRNVETEPTRGAWSQICCASSKSGNGFNYRAIDVPLFWRGWIFSYTGLERQLCFFVAKSENSQNSIL